MHILHPVNFFFCEKQDLAGNHIIEMYVLNHLTDGFSFLPF